MPILAEIFYLGGGNSDMFNFHPENWGRFSIWRAYFSSGLKPPTSYIYIFGRCRFAVDLIGVASVTKAFTSKSAAGLKLQKYQQFNTSPLKDGWLGRGSMIGSWILSFFGFRPPKGSMELVPGGPLPDVTWVITPITRVIAPVTY